MRLIGKPVRKKMTITNDQVFEILVLVEKQGGNKECAAKINRIFEQIEKEHDK